MNRQFSLLPLCCVITTALSSALNAADAIHVAAGLTIRMVAEDDLVPDCTAIACDQAGNVIASGPGYIRRLVDTDSNGNFDSYVTIVEGLKHGAHGLCFDEQFLYYVADGGVWRVNLDSSRGPIDARPERVLDIATGGEHHAHALRKGPDGNWYLIAGNGTTGMYELQNALNPIVAKPRAGVIWRISPDWKTREVWAHGFRNAYDFDFAPDHSIITYDSDGERDVSLPWYRPTRIFRVRQGEDAGWMTRSWKRPDYDPEMPEVLAATGRGSPTGVVRYRHNRLAHRLQAGTFALDWTFGRVFLVTDDGQSELIAEPTGTAGFAVTDIDALSDGRVILSVGGRGSRGGLYMLDVREPSLSGETIAVDWSVAEKPKERLAVESRIRELRSRDVVQIDQASLRYAVERLETAELERERIGALILLVESLGGLGEAASSDPRPPVDRAAVFDGYRSQLAPELPLDVKTRITNCLTTLLNSPASTEQLRSEAVRTLAVIEADSPASLSAILDELQRHENPISQLHCLFAVARLRASVDSQASARICQALVEIPVRTTELKLNVDSNWSPRLEECLAALQARDSTLTAQLVSHVGFGHPSHLVWAEGLRGEILQAACDRLLRHETSRMDARVAQFLSSSRSELPRTIVDQWLTVESTRSAAWLAMSQHPLQSDAEELQKAAHALDQRLQKSARTALERLGVPVLQRSSSSKSIEGWWQDSPKIFALQGEVLQGEELFGARQCARCHNATKALGPSLVGISKRFGREDLLRATIDPSHTIPDRYQSIQVLTEDGEILTGLKIYESVDGLTLLSATAETLRINASAIAQQKKLTTSLMPEGLLDGLAPQQVADLLAYMQSL